MNRAVVVVAAAVVVVGGLAVAAVLLLGRGGLPSTAVGSVPPLLSHAAGIPGAELTLRPDGLGEIAFGTPEDDAFAALTTALGQPTEDAPQPCSSETDLVRHVRWGNLTAAFPGGTFSGYIIGTYYPPDSPELPMTTEEGLALRASAAQLAATYGDRLAWVAEEDMGFGAPVDGFGVDGFDPDEPSPTGIGGFVEGGREDGHVITFFAGQPCGPPME